MIDFQDRSYKDREDNLHIEFNEEFNHPHEINDDLRVLREAGGDVQEEIHLHINSFGGSASVAVQLINAIQECQAVTVAHIEGDALSTHSLITLACDVIEVSPYSRMLIHSGSLELGGSTSVVKGFLEASNELNNKVFKDVYRGFLSDQEIELVLGGVDIWLDSDEIIERVITKAKLVL